MFHHNYIDLFNRLAFQKYPSLKLTLIGSVARQYMSLESSVIMFSGFAVVLLDIADRVLANMNRIYKSTAP